MPPILLTASELADRLDTTYDNVLTWARREVIPSILDGTGRRYFNLASVLKALRERAGQEASLVEAVSQ